jgi:SAM-dependent methyltransferase
MGSNSLLRRLLVHPLTAKLSLDDPSTTELRKQIISSKPFLRDIYSEWYRTLALGLPDLKGSVLELGSGAGFLEDYIPGLITSEIFCCSTVRLVADAAEMPFGDNSLRAIVFTDVLHHMPDVQRFFNEASRCLRQGGKILMIEPWVTPWSRFIYGNFHHEPFLPEAKDWSFPSSGPLSGANGAIPWMVFVRDRQRFESEYPEFVIDTIRPCLPFRYLLSGGVGMRSLVPNWSRSVWARLESVMEPFTSHLGMFAFVSVQKR